MNNNWPLDTAVSFDPYFGEPDRDGDQRYEILEGGKVFLRLKAPGASSVEIDQFGKRFRCKRQTATCGKASLLSAAAFSTYS